MIYKPKGRRFYCIKFRFEGRLIYKRTKHTTAAGARVAESKLRTELANGNFGILVPKPPAPTCVIFSRTIFYPLSRSNMPPSPRPWSTTNMGLRN